MIRFFFRFLREKEKTRVFDKDSRAKAWRESLPEKGNMLTKMLETQKMAPQRVKKMLLFWVEILA
jgi:hypothetical protein